MVSSAQTWKNGKMGGHTLKGCLYEFHLMKLATGFPKLSLAANSKT